MLRIVFASCLALALAASAVWAGTQAPMPSQQLLLASSLTIGTPVFGSDGRQIGEINRISASASGEITGLRVTIGAKAGLDAKTVEIKPDQIEKAGQTTKVSITLDQARKEAGFAAPQG